MNSYTFGYHPLDPLPVSLNFRQINPDEDDGRTRNQRLMQSLPDETMRLAIGEISGKGNLTFSSAEIGYEGRSYRSD
jgi:hypothetical protein